MNVLLIDPPYSRFMNYYRFFYPIGLTYIAGALKQKGHNVQTYDSEHNTTLTPVKFRDITSSYNGYIEALKNKNHQVWNEVRDTIRACKPDVVGISSIAPCKISSTLRVAEIAKECDSVRKVIVGGQLTITDIDYVLRSQYVDFVVRGEGEITSVELLDRLEETDKVKDVKGISFKKDGKVVHTSDRPFVKDLDSLGFPYIESLIWLESYRPIDHGKVITSRGCPYSCNFCGLKEFWGRIIRWNSVEHVVQEVVRLREKFNVRYFCFRDASFTLRRESTLQLCKKLLEIDPEIKWECTTRIDLLDSELIRIIKRTGCQKIRIGIESGSEKILKSLNKGITTDTIIKQAQLLKDNKMTWLAYFMFGMPDETEEDMLATMNLIKKIKPDFVTVGTFYPVPNTEIFNDLKSRGELPENTDPNLFSMRVLSKHYLRYMSLEQYQKLMKKIVRLTEKIYSKHYSVDQLFSEQMVPCKTKNKAKTR